MVICAFAFFQQHAVWIYVDRVYHSYRLPENSTVLDILKHYKLEEEMKDLKEKVKESEKELKDLKEKLEPDRQRILACEQRIVSYNQRIVALTNSPSAPDVDGSEYEFSSCSWGDISIDTQCSDLFDKGIGKDKKSAIRIIEKGENSLPFLVALF